MHKILRVKHGLTYCLPSVPWVHLKVWVVIDNTLLLITVVVRAMVFFTQTILKKRSTLTSLIVAWVVLELLPSMTIAATILELAPILIGLSIFL